MNDRYLILEELRRDPRFVRFRALDRTLDCEVMLDRPGDALRPQLASREGRDALREAKMLAKLTHPSLVRLREVVVLDGLPTLVLDLPLGRPLDEVLERDGAFDEGRLISFARRLAAAVHAVHAEGIVHRGVSPENVIVEPGDGGVRLTGFTFAKPLSGTARTTTFAVGSSDRAVLADQGLPTYPAPEQIAGQRADARADVFAFGCLLYRCASGRDAFAADLLEYRRPVPLQGLGAGISKGFSRLVDSCLERSPQERLPSMLAVLEQLDIVEEERSLGCRPARAGSDRVLLTSLVLAVGLIAVVAGFIAVTVLRDPRLSDSETWRASVEESREASSGSIARFKPVVTAHRALLIGIDYKGTQLQQLPNAHRDIDAIRGALAELGWEDDEMTVLRGGQATREAILCELESIRSMDRNGVALVYFAGHGRLTGNQRALDLLPADAQEGARGTWLVGERLTSRFLDDAAGPKHCLVVLDTCHSGGAAARSGREQPRIGARPLPRDMSAGMHFRRYARWFLASCRAEQQVSDGDDGNSPFARKFLQVLADAREADVQIVDAYTKLQKQLLWQQPVLTSFRDSAPFLLRRRD